MKTAGKIIIAGVVIGGIAIAATAAAKSSGGSKKPTGNDVDPSFDPFDPGKNTPGGGGGGSTPKLGPGGFRTYGGGGDGGLIFGHISDAGVNGVDWNPNGNTVRFSHDCSVVLVGRQVWTMHETIDVAGQNPVHVSNCVEFADVKTCWRNGQNLCCFIDYLMNQEGFTSARLIGAAMLKGMAPPCINDDYDAWPKAMQDFVDWLRPLVNEYVLGSSGQADW